MSVCVCVCICFHVCLCVCVCANVLCSIDLQCPVNSRAGQVRGIEQERGKDSFIVDVRFRYFFYFNLCKYECFSYLS